MNLTMVAAYTQSSAAIATRMLKVSSKGHMVLAEERG